MEDFLKNKTKQLKIEPKASTWEGIENHLLQKKKKRIVWVYLLLGVLIGSGMSAALFMSDFNSKSNTALNDKSSEKEDINSRIKSNENLNTEKPQVEIIAQDKNQIQQNTITNKDQNEITIASSKTEVLPEKSDIKSSISPNNSIRENSANNFSTSVKEENLVQAEQLKQTNIINTKKSEITIPLLTSVGFTSFPYSIGRFAKPQIIETTKTFATNSKSKDQGIVSIPPLKNKNRLMAYYTYGQSFYKKNKETNKTQPSPNSYVSPDTFPSYLSEKASNSWSAGLNFERELKHHFFWGAGLTYQKLTWSGKIGEQSELLQLDNHGNKTLRDSITDITTGRNELYSVAVGQRDQGFKPGEQNFSSSYQFFGLPVYLGYQVPIKNNWQISARVGTQLNYVHKANLLHYYSVVSTILAQNEESNSMHNFSMSVSGSLGLEYMVNKNVSFYLAPEYQRFISTIHQSEESSPKTRLPYDMKIKSALIYRFN